MDEIIKIASGGVALVSELMKAAGDNPQVKQAGSNLGEAALTITKTINNALLPLAAVNFAFDKCRRYFSERFADDLSLKLSGIPSEDVIEPKASIAGPALQGLAFTHEEESLRELYLCLLGTAMDRRTAQRAHPAFVEIIRQLTSEEAKLFSDIIQKRDIQALAELRLTQPGGGFVVFAAHLFPDAPHEAGQHPAKNAAMIENFERRGLLVADYRTRLLGAQDYDWVLSRPEYLQIVSVPKINAASVVVRQGTLEATAFGQQFAEAVGIL